MVQLIHTRTIRTRSRSVKNVVDAKLEKTSLSANVFLGYLMVIVFKLNDILETSLSLTYNIESVTINSRNRL